MATKQHFSSLTKGYLGLCKLIEKYISRSGFTSDTVVIGLFAPEKSLFPDERACDDDNVNLV